MTVEIQEESRLWWHTVLQVVAATILLVPAIYATGFALVVVSFLQGEGINFVMRGFQYGFAAFLSLFLPSLVLKRSHTIVAASVWCTAVTTIYVLMLALGVSLGVSDAGFWDWLEILAGIAGFIGGSIAYAIADND